MRTRRSAGAAMLLLWSVAACAPVTAEIPMRTKVPYVEKAKTVGPKLHEKEALETWLANAHEAVLRLPVTIERGGYGQRVGAKLGEREVGIDDSALGLSLTDRLRSASPSENPCRVWVEGRWRDGTIQVLHFERAVAAGEAADFVEREP